MSRIKKLAITAIGIGFVAMTFLLTVTALTSLTVISSQVEEIYVRSTVGSEAVKVTGERGSGSGFYLKYKGKNIIVTNRHVCAIKSSEGNLKVSDEIQKQRTVYVLHESNLADICILSGDEKSHGLEISSSAVTSGQKVYIVGHPSGQAQTVSRAFFIQEIPITVMYEELITSISSQFHGYSRGGSSGSVITDIFGEVIGVLYAGNPYDNMQTFGVTLEQLKNVLAEFDKK